MGLWHIDPLRTHAQWYNFRAKDVSLAQKLGGKQPTGNELSMKCKKDFDPRVFAALMYVLAHIYGELRGLFSRWASP